MNKLNLIENLTALKKDTRDEPPWDVGNIFAAQVRNQVVDECIVVAKAYLKDLDVEVDKSFDRFIKKLKIPFNP